MTARVAPSIGSSTPWARAVAPPAIASFASASPGAWTIARSPRSRASPIKAFETSGCIRGSRGFGSRHQPMSSSMSLISEDPSSFALRTEARAAAGVGGKRSRWPSAGSPWSHQPPFVVKMGAAGKTSGTSDLVLDSEASLSVAATSSAISRTEVTPQSSIVSRSRSDSAWTWASISPGRIHFPPASRTSAPAGRAATAAGVAVPTETIRPFSTTRSAFDRGGAPVPSMTVAPRKTSVANRSVLTGDRSLFFELLFRDLDGIYPGEAGGAGRLKRAAEGLEHPLRRQIAERVGTDELPDLLDRAVRGDQLPTGRRVDSIVAGGHCRRRRNAHVDLADAGFAQHSDDPFGR